MTTDPTTKPQPEVATVIVTLAFLIVAVAGAIVVIVDPDELGFREYIEALGLTAIGAGALGIGRGILAAARVAHSAPTNTTMPVGSVATTRPTSEP